MENIRTNDEQTEQEGTEEALQLVKTEQRPPEPPGAPAGPGGSPPPQSQSVITSRRALRTITAAGHITEEAVPDDADAVKDEPPEPPPAPPDDQPPPPQYHELDEHYDERHEAARYLTFKQEPYPPRAPHPPRAPPQYPRAPYPRSLALRYSHAHSAHEASEHEQQYGEAQEEARQYAAALGDQQATSSALEMIQATTLADQQAVGVAYQQVKYETRADEPRPTTYASLQPVTSVHGGYYAAPAQSPQYSAAYSTYAPAAAGKEMLTLYGAGGTGRGTGDESPPGQLLYRSDPTLSSSSLAPRQHVVYGSVVPQSQQVYEAPPSPNSQQVISLYHSELSILCRSVKPL